MKLKSNQSVNPSQKFEGIADEIVSLLDKKNKDYGDGNLLRHGLYGILVRVDDKTARISNLLKSESSFESIEDNLIDIAGYAINAIRLLRENEEFSKI